MYLCDNIVFSTQNGAVNLISLCWHVFVKVGLYPHVNYFCPCQKKLAVQIELIMNNTLEQANVVEKDASMQRLDLFALWPVVY